MVAHFAQLDDNNIVLQVLVVSNDDCRDANGNESEAVGIAFLQGLFGADTIWKQTSYNGRFRRQYAGVGGGYSPTVDVFYDPKPYPSWLFNSSDATWYAPVAPPYPVPADAILMWNEDKMQWDVLRGEKQQ